MASLVPPTNGFVASEAMKFYDRIGKPEKSTEVIRKAVEQAPENLSLRSHLSTRLRNHGDVEAAEKVLLEARTLWQQLAHGHIRKLKQNAHVI